MNAKNLLPVASTYVDGKDRFVTRDHFKVAVSENDVAVRISHIGQAFRLFFMDRVEESVEPCRIGCFNLSAAVSDFDIQQELGTGYALKLGHIWQLLKNQGHGEAGPLITNTWPNVFHIETNDGTILPVSAQWWGYGVWTINGGFAFRTPAYMNTSRVFGRWQKLV